MVRPQSHTNFTVAWVDVSIKESKIGGSSVDDEGQIVKALSDQFLIRSLKLSELLFGPRRDATVARELCCSIGGYELRAVGCRIFRGIHIKFGIAVEGLRFVGDGWIKPLDVEPSA